MAHLNFLRYFLLTTTLAYPPTPNPHTRARAPVLGVVITVYYNIFRGVKRSGSHEFQVERMHAGSPFGAHGVQINFVKV